MWTYLTVPFLLAEPSFSADELEPEAMGKRLVGRMSGRWSARVGSYRVLYTIEQSEQQALPDNTVK